MTFADGPPDDGQPDFTAPDFNAPDFTAPDFNAVEQACSKFAAAWVSGVPPDLNDYLQNMTAVTKRYALCELLWIEWEQLRRLGTPPNLPAYLTRFAEFPDSVQEAWRSDYGRLVTEPQAKKTRGGRYTILKPHARGGIGQVYVAADDELERQVALKEIQLRHSHSINVCERFVREAKITGKLEHPGIVPVYSFGKNEDGSPYYVTRFIHGESLEAAITQWHEQYQGRRGKVEPVAVSASLRESGSGNGKSHGDPSVNGVKSPHVARPSGAISRRGSAKTRTGREAYRSRAFRQLVSRVVHVCHVIEYAHSHGVLHRDLKPANIMLGKFGETLVVDWGLAKEAGEPEPVAARGGSISALTSTSFTTHGALIGTVSYMSPEQAAGKLEQLTSASDLYSLGATLYHILVGQPPLAGEPQEQALDRIQRGDIPSAKVVQPAVPQPLDAICATAMSLNPEKRYASAIALADDLEHWLADETVSAYAEPLRARAARWARRHQTAMTSGLIAALLLAIASVTITTLIAINNHHLSVARSDAETRRRAADQARSEAEEQRDLSNAITEFMVKSFRSPDPEEDGKSITVAELLDHSFDDLKSNSRIKTQTKVRLLGSLAESNIGLGLYSRAVEIGKYAEEYCKQHLANDQKLLLEIQTILTKAVLVDGQNPSAVSNSEAIVNKTNQFYGRNSPVAISRCVDLAQAYCSGRRFSDALALLNKVIPESRALLGHAHPTTIVAEYTRALVYLELRDFESSISTLNNIYEYEKTQLGIDHPDTLKTQNSLASTYQEAGQFNTAITLFKDLLENRRTRLGNAHPLTLNTQNNLANCYQDAGMLNDAKSMHQSTIELRTHQLGANHRSTLRSQSGLADVYLDEGDIEKAEALLRVTLEKQTRFFGEHDFSTLLTQKRLATALFLSGKTQDSINLLESLCEILESKCAPQDKVLINAKATLAQAYRRLGRSKEAVAIYRNLVAVAGKVLGVDHPEMLTLENNLATALIGAGELDEAIKAYERSLSGSVRTLGATHPATLQTKVNLGLCLQRGGDHRRASSVLEAAVKETADKLGWKHSLTLQAHLGLAGSLGHLGKTSESQNLYKQLVAQLTEHLGATHINTVTANRFLAGFYSREERFPEAIVLMRSLVAGLKESLGVDNELTTDSMSELATILMLSLDYRSAESCFEELVATGMNQSDKKAETMYLLGKCRIKLEKYSAAEDALRECLKLRRQLSPDEWSIFVTESALGEVLTKEKKFEEAETLLLSLLQNLNAVKVPGDASERDRIIEETTRRILELYKSKGDQLNYDKWKSLLPATTKTKSQ